MAISVIMAISILVISACFFAGGRFALLSAHLFSYSLGVSSFWLLSCTEGSIDVLTPGFDQQSALKDGEGGLTNQRGRRGLIVKEIKMKPTLEKRCAAVINSAHCC